MKKSIILLLVLAALVGVAVVTKNQQDARLSENTRRGVKTRELLLPNLAVNSVKTVVVQDQDSAVHLKIEGDIWKVEERSGYPADFTKLSGALLELKDAKISGKQIIGRSAWKEEDLLEPSDGNTEGTGTLVKLLDEKGAEVSSVILGKEVATSGTNSQQMGQTSPRFVRLPADEDSIWMVVSPFYDLKSKPADWLDKSFIQVSKLKELEVTPGDGSTGWKLNRSSEDNTDYQLVDAGDNEELEVSKLSLATLLSSPSFEDVKKLEEASDLFAQATKARITTFDDFTYQLRVAKDSADGSDKYWLSMVVEATIPTERTPQENEKAEDKERLDSEFKAKTEPLKEKLEREKKLEGWAYQVSEFVVNNLLLSRADVTKEKEIDLTAKPPGEGDVVAPNPGKEAVPTPENPPGQ